MIARVRMCKKVKPSKGFLKHFYIQGLKARYLSTHYFVNNGFIFLRGGVECISSGYKCVDCIKR